MLGSEKIAVLIMCFNSAYLLLNEVLLMKFWFLEYSYGPFIQILGNKTNL